MLHLRPTQRDYSSNKSVTTSSCPFPQSQRKQEQNPTEHTSLLIVLLTLLLRHLLHVCHTHFLLVGIDVLLTLRRELGFPLAFAFLSFVNRILLVGIDLLSTFWGVCFFRNIRTEYRKISKDGKCWLDRFLN